MSFTRLGLLALLASLPASGECELLSASRADAFVRAFIGQRAELTSFIHPDALAMSKRLGISYEGVDHKFLISYDVDRDIRATTDHEMVRREFRVLDRDRGIASLTLGVQGMVGELECLFEDSLLISPISHYTRDWAELESEHFKFLVSDTVHFNRYCVTNLERFFNEMAHLLQFSDDELETIKTHKLFYVLCQDEDEMELLTGYRARGMYNLAYDCVITRFNAHYHELVHQLVNFKLQSLQMYTHPMLQEGLAVALGGRGGKEPGPILSLGSFLAESGMISHTALLTKSNFYSVDPSMSYPLCGLYNRFLLTEMGIESYLELYRRYSGSFRQVDTMRFAATDLPADSLWQAFLGAASSFQSIMLSRDNETTQTTHGASDSAFIGPIGAYRFAIADTMLFGGSDSLSQYRSTQFVELFGDREYRGEKFAIVADPNEISVYNLYTNNLIAKLVGGFMNPPVAIEKIDDRYQFTIDRSAFDENLSELLLGR